ncbi:hypothetical protein CAOG_07776 [Capsaspora owczarzaki ATCC 30864]|uniref:Uncharacterized protein n=1 Tax=Capsaspora owczarzaki (strain ATCC 30864) TaxID=595528 RepID=A0A0D2X5E5_CAPO3|nr:hypothetical protein CAOG_07776 [Capsaspora owczarzaki ATCC 30864]KJE97669.1 hypothetical protein CAOG_007776 [Capsaspora owczarzaki ATCC 30864]|eukprot:XP_004342849.1 hypothetical protein CAOG_07776 [Capsaspora owczarzaki ATCC 30864]
MKHLSASLAVVAFCVIVSLATSIYAVPIAIAQKPDSAAMAERDYHRVGLAAKLARLNNNNHKKIQLPAARVGNESDWSSCIDIPVLGETCLVLYVIPENLTLGAKLTIDNHTVLDEELDGNHICLSDTSLLSLLELIPALIPFKAIIDAIIKADKYIPAHILSICLNLTNVVFNSTSVSGCADLDSNIMCFESKCLYSGDDSFGCFNIPTF